MVGVKDENPDADLDAEVESFLEEDPEDPF